MSDKSGYNPESLDSHLTRIITTLEAHVNETREYRKRKDARDAAIENRVASLEGDRKKILGIAIGAGVGSGGVAGTLLKFLGSGNGQ
jgi:hypothetical protein